MTTKIGPLPIVTERTITEPGWYWFEPAYPGLTGGSPRFMQVDSDAITGGWLECHKYAGQYAGPVEPPGHKFLPRRHKDIEAPSNSALNDLQDSVWKSLGNYSNKLGWGLTGIQPECWTLLDAAVDELAKRRAADEQIVRIITRLDHRCQLRDCPTHGSYTPEDYQCLTNILVRGKLIT